MIGLVLQRLAGVSSWSLYVGAVLAVISVIVDAIALTLGHASVVTTARAVVVSAMLAWITGNLLGCLSVLAPARLATASSAVRGATYAAASAAAFAFMWHLTRPFEHRETGPYIVIITLSSAAVGLCVWLSRAQPPRLARGVACTLALGALGIDVAIGSSWYLSLHDTAATVAVAAGCAAALPLRERLAAYSPRGLVALALASTLVALALVLQLDSLWPGWRTFEVRHAQNLRRHVEVIGALWDLDRDGYTTILWGGDCDDRDDRVHPGAPDAPGGGDRNCNGADPPLMAADRDRGLAPAFGEPALPPAAVRDVLLITIDTWRADALDPRLMPRLWEHAKRGLTLARAYPGATSTHKSIALWFNERADQPGLLDALRAEHVGTAAAVDRIDARVLPRAPFDVTERVPTGVEVTRRALAWLRAPASTPERRRFFWAHYYGPHSPEKVAGAEVPAEPRLLRPTYRQSVRLVDAEVATLLDELVRSGALDHTLVIITADHGTGMGEHDVYSHARTGFEEIVRVPCIVLGAGFPSDTYPYPVSTRGIAATVLGAFGLREASLGAERMGRSLLRLRESRARRLHNAVFVHSDRTSSGWLAESPLGVLIDERYKLVWGFEDQFVELYDLRSDPGEMLNLASTRPELVRERRHLLALIADLDTYPKPPWVSRL